MKTTRVYRLPRVFELFKEAGIHGSYRRVLAREGFSPVAVIDGVAAYDAEAIDSFLALVRL